MVHFETMTQHPDLLVKIATAAAAVGNKPTALTLNKYNSIHSNIVFFYDSFNQQTKFVSLREEEVHW